MSRKNNKAISTLRGKKKTNFTLETKQGGLLDKD